jgi:anaerobic magnesium-protoporphyrin IX monomethyl ester cyclase
MPASDIHLIFPPQWSPFQPFLSTPSLKAYLNAKGYRAFQSDWNVDFYEYFIDRARLPTALARLTRYVRELPTEFENYRNQAYLALGTLKDYSAKRKLTERLRFSNCTDSVEDFFECVTAFKRLLYAFSVAEPVVELGTSSLSTHAVLSSMESIHHFCDSEEQNPFKPFFKTKVAELENAPRYFGISIIGSEQVLPALTLGACLKARFPGIPIVIGGSIFSRLLDRTDTVRHLFGRYFDVIVRYEGERPLEQLLASDSPSARVPGIAYFEGEKLKLTELPPQLPMEDIPTPDFSDLNLNKYFTPEVVLPVLSTRGCYWDKCAFCYHGMIYGDRYRMRSPKMFLQDVTSLNSKHNVTHFALNDEAIPPKLFEKLPMEFPKGRFFFTALYKFEKYFRKHHYQGMYDIGFRSLYIGLESANERIQRHMKKNNTQRVMLSNLRDAHEAGIWNHTFNFFGFPTETPDEAMETAQFIIDHRDIIHSEGTGTFSFEHNAPISKHPEGFGITNVTTKTGNVLELYYDYEVASGLSQDDALKMLETFGDMKKAEGAFKYSGWIPREHLLVLLSKHERDGLRKKLELLDSELRSGAHWSDISWFTLEISDRPRFFIVNCQAGKVLETNQDAVLVLELAPKDVPLQTIAKTFPALAPVLAA